MPTPVSHAAVGFAIGTWTAPVRPSTRVCLAATACAALPDIDVLWSSGLPASSPFSHRALTHSLLFALVAATVIAVVFFSDASWRPTRTRIAGVLLLALLSHSCLDMLSTYSRGIGLFVPFSEHRFRWPWTPLGRPTGTILSQLVEEALVILLPAAALVWVGWRAREDHSHPSR
jgi:inner membrane protein